MKINCYFCFIVFWSLFSQRVLGSIASSRSNSDARSSFTILSLQARAMYHLQKQRLHDACHSYFLRYFVGLGIPEVSLFY